MATAQPVTLTFTAATTSTTAFSIQLTKASIMPSVTSALTLNGPFTFNTMTISGHTISFTVAAAATAVAGSITLPVSSDGSPSVAVNNLNADTVTVTWPTEDGPVTQELTPGTPMALSGWIGSGG